MLRHAVSVTTPDRLLFSTDHPYQQPSAVEIEAFLAEFTDPEERVASAFGNARRLFGITG